MGLVDRRRRATSASGRTTPTPRRPRSSSSSIAWLSCARSTPTCTSSTTHRTSGPSCGRCRSVRHARGRGRRPAARRGPVDLYAVVRQGLQVGEESYSLKKLERHHGFGAWRSGSARAAARSSPTRPGWRPATTSCWRRSAPTTRRTAARRSRCATGCLTDMRPEAEAQFGVDFDDYASPSPRRSTAHRSWMPDVIALIERAHRGLPAHGDEDTPIRPSGACSRTCCSTTSARASRRGGATSTCAE